MPARVYFKNGYFRYLVPAEMRATVDKTWVKLGKTGKEALIAYAEFMAKQGISTGMASLFDRYFVEIVPQKAERTQKDNRREIEYLKKAFGHMTPQQIRPVHAAQYLDIRGRQSKVQANHELALLSHVFTWGKRWGIVDSNPCQGMARHKLKARTRLVSNEELAIFKKRATGFIKLYVDLKYQTGLRKGDLLKLKLSDIKDTGILIKTSKTNKAGLVVMTEELRATIKKIMSLNKVQGQTLICDKRGRPLKEGTFNSRWRECMNKALTSGELIERFTEHDIRAKHATDAQEQGLNATDQMLHENATTTKAYLRSKKTTQVTPLKPRF